MTPYEHIEKLVNELTSISILRYFSQGKKSELNFRTGVHPNEMFVTLVRKQTSSAEAKQKRYNYHFEINFIYGPERKRFNQHYPKDRSYTAILRYSLSMILNRAIQHFNVKDELERQRIKALALGL